MSELIEETARKNDPDYIEASVFLEAYDAYMKDKSHPWHYENAAYAKRIRRTHIPNYPIRYYILDRSAYPDTHYERDRGSSSWEHHEGTPPWKLITTPEGPRYRLDESRGWVRDYTAKPKAKL